MSPDLAPETVVDGRYRIHHRLGSGGMADVYVAHDDQLGRSVALKLLHRRFAEDPQFVERFRREASAAAGLSHPNVVGVYDRGEWDGTYYIAMEFLEGRTLKDIILSDAPLDPVWSIDITVQILRALRFAHKRGIVHRDIKPHNVIVDDEGRAKVTDFGIARAGASEMTETGSIMGTAQYLAPEQAQGHQVGPAADLYAVGIVLYELLTGQLPFQGDSAVTIALKQVSERPVPPGNLADVPDDLESVVLVALEKEPARRFPDADAFVEALEQVRARIVAGEPVGEGTVVFGAVAAGALAGATPPLAGPLPVAIPEDAASGERERRNWPWIAALIAVIVAAVAALVLFVVLPAVSPQQTVVPNVTGAQLSAAVAALQNDGFEVEIVRTQTDAPRDRVTRQDPQPGTRADEGSTVTLTVSSGPGSETVPDVVGRTESTAKKALESRGFEVDVNDESSSSVTSGRATRTLPAAGEQLERGSQVTLYVSTGPEQLAVPSVVGVTRDTAVSRLEGAGFQVEVTRQESTTVEPDTVLTQNPDAGTNAPKGSVVAIVVAKAPPEVTVPAVVGEAEDDATRSLEAAGFKVVSEPQDVDSPSQDGLVQSQSPPAGSRQQQGSTVTLAVGVFEPPPAEEVP